MLSRFIRWHYVFTRLTLLAAGCVAVWLGFDAAFKLALVNAVELAAGAHVEIGRVHTKFFPPSAEIEHATVADRADPLTNIFEFSRLSFNLRLRPLLEKKFIVDDAELSGLRFGTRRAASGAQLWHTDSVFDSPRLARLEASGRNFLMGVIGEGQERKLSSLVIKEDELYCVKLARSVKARSAADAKSLRSAITRGAFFSRSVRLKNAIARAQKLKTRSATLKALRALEPSAARLEEDLATVRRAARDSFFDMRGTAATLPQARVQDAAELMYKLKLPRLDPDSISTALFGGPASSCFEKALHWYGVARAYMPEQLDAPLINPEGKIIHFPQKLHYPAFAISNLAISGELDPGDGGAPISLAGSAQGITSSPSVYGAPLKINLAGKRDGRSFSFSALMDHTSPVKRDSFKFSARGFPAGSYVAGSPASLELTLKGGKLTSEGEMAVSGDTLFGVVLLTVAKPALSSRSLLSYQYIHDAQMAVARVAAGLSSATAEMKVTGTINSPQVALSSDAGEQLSAELSAVAGPAAEELRSGLEKRIAEVSASSQADMEAALAEQEIALQDLLERVAAPVDAASRELKTALFQETDVEIR